MIYNYGDRVGNAVYVRAHDGSGNTDGKWLDVTTGQFVGFPDFLGYRSEPRIIQSSRYAIGRPDYIDLIRYVRPWDIKTRQIDNMNGTTFYIRLDYKAKTIQFSYSVCSDENFSKEYGVSIATQRFLAEDYVTIPMYNGCIGEGGVLQEIYEHGYDFLVPRVKRHFDCAGYHR